jgi:hypothetical protein
VGGSEPQLARHSREGGNPAPSFVAVEKDKIENQTPAFAGMKSKETTK